MRRYLMGEEAERTDHMNPRGYQRRRVKCCEVEEPVEEYDWTELLSPETRRRLEERTRES